MSKKYVMDIEAEQLAQPAGSQYAPGPAPSMRAVTVPAALQAPPPPAPVEPATPTPSTPPAVPPPAPPPAKPLPVMDGGATPPAVEAKPPLPEAPVSQPLPAQPPMVAPMARSLPVMDVEKPEPTRGFNLLDYFRERIEAAETPSEVYAVLKEAKRKGYDVELQGRYGPDTRYVPFVIGDPWTGRFIAGHYAEKRGELVEKSVEAGRVAFEGAPLGTLVDWQFIEEACKPTLLAVPNLDPVYEKSAVRMKKLAEEFGIQADFPIRWEYGLHPNIYAHLRDLQRRLAIELSEKAGLDMGQGLGKLVGLEPYQFLEALEKAKIRTPEGREMPFLDYVRLRMEQERKEKEEQAAKPVDAETRKVFEGAIQRAVEGENKWLARNMLGGLLQVGVPSFFPLPPPLEKHVRERVMAARTPEKERIAVEMGPLDWFKEGFAAAYHIFPTFTSTLVMKHVAPRREELYADTALGKLPAVGPGDPLSAMTFATGATLGTLTGLGTWYAEGKAIGLAVSKLVAPAVKKGAQLHRVAVERLKEAREARQLGQAIQWRLAETFTKPFPTVERVGGAIAKRFFTYSTDVPEEILAMEAGHGKAGGIAGKVAHKVAQAVTKGDDFYHLAAERLQEAREAGQLGETVKWGLAKAASSPFHAAKKVGQAAAEALRGEQVVYRIPKKVEHVMGKVAGEEGERVMWMTRVKEWQQVQPELAKQLAKRSEPLGFIPVKKGGVTVKVPWVQKGYTIAHLDLPEEHVFYGLGEKALGESIRVGDYPASTAVSKKIIGRVDVEALKSVLQPKAATPLGGQPAAPAAPISEAAKTVVKEVSLLKPGERLFIATPRKSLYLFTGKEKASSLAVGGLGKPGPAPGPGPGGPAPGGAGGGAATGGAAPSSPPSSGGAVGGAVKKVADLVSGATKNVSSTVDFKEVFLGKAMKQALLVQTEPVNRVSTALSFSVPVRVEVLQQPFVHVPPLSMPSLPAPSGEMPKPAVQQPAKAGAKAAKPVEVALPEVRGAAVRPVEVSLPATREMPKAREMMSMPVKLEELTKPITPVVVDPRELLPKIAPFSVPVRAEKMEEKPLVPIPSFPARVDVKDVTRLGVAPFTGAWQSAATRTVLQPLAKTAFKPSVKLDLGPAWSMDITVPPISPPGHPSSSQPPAAAGTGGRSSAWGEYWTVDWLKAFTGPLFGRRRRRGGW